MIDELTKLRLVYMDNLINNTIDDLIFKRDSSVGATKVQYRHIIRRLQAMLTPLHSAQDEVNGQSNKSAQTTN